MSESGATNSGCTAVTAFLRLEDPNGKQSFIPPLKDIIDLPPSAITSPGAGSVKADTKATEQTGLSRILPKNMKGSTDSKNVPDVDEPGHGQNKPPRDPSGTIRRVLYTANAGDARAVLARHGTGVRLTYDHKGNDKQEVRRIQEAGGFVLNNRVNGTSLPPCASVILADYLLGVLAVTRSLGDSAMKEFVVGSPYTSEMELCDGDKWLIVACDGVSRSH